MGFRLASVLAGGVTRAQIEPTREPDAKPWTAILLSDAPSPAIAPFDAATAKRHQQAWAGYLGVSLEQDVELGDGVRLKMALIPPGEFLMGSTAEEQARFLDACLAVQVEGLIERDTCRVIPPVGIKDEFNRQEFSSGNRGHGNFLTLLSWFDTNIVQLRGRS